MSKDEELEDILNEIKNRNDEAKEEKIPEEQPSGEPEEQPENEPEQKTEEPEPEMKLEESEPETVPEEAEEEQEEIVKFNEVEESEMSKKSKKPAVIGIIAVILVAVAVALAVIIPKMQNKPEEPATEPPAPAVSDEVTEPVSTAVNPLTGQSGYNEKAIGKRPVSVVVENSPAARPQWGIDTPDIIVEGEVEGGISRMLWFYADYTAVPEKVGPVRSARPSYVKFSEFFDSVFIHWGGSHDNGSYTGGYSAIKNDGVNDLDGMNGGAAFGRDKTRSVSSEHRGVLYGNNIAAAIEKKNYRTELDESKTSTLVFYDEATNVGETKCEELSCKFSSRATETKTFVYNSGDSLYHNTASYKTDVSFANVIVLSLPSEYITVPYKGSRTTYLNYKYTSGSGKLASNGTVTDISWSVDNNKLVLNDAQGNELKLNQGKSWIGLASSNNGGKTTIK